MACSRNCLASLQLLCLAFIGLCALCAATPPEIFCSSPRLYSGPSCNGSDVRRFFSRSPRGCKPFGICEHDAAEHDKETEINYFVTYAECQAACMSHIRCPELELVENADQRSNGYVGWGEVITYSCQEGFSFVQDSDRKRTCQQNGTWSGRVPVCKADCLVPAILPPLMIQPVKAVFKFGDRIFYGCSEGDLVGSEYRTCIENGIWSGSQPACEVLTQCQQPDPILHGTLSADDDAITSVNTTITYMCDPGYTLVGNKTQECRDDGWSVEQPVCTKLELKSRQGNATNTNELDITNDTLVLAVEKRDVTLTCSLVGLDITLQSPVVWEYDRQGNGDFVTVYGTYINSNGTTHAKTEGEGPHGVMQMLDVDQSKLFFTKILTSQEEQSGRYRCTAGGFSAYFDLESMNTEEIIKLPPVLVLEPSSRDARMGEDIRFSCVFDGCPNNVTWFHNGDEINIDERITTSEISITSLITLTHLDIHDIHPVDAGFYICYGENEVGFIESHTATLTLLKVEETAENPQVSAPDVRRKRNTICSNTDKDTVRLVGRVRKQIRRPSSELDSYRIQVQRLLTDDTNMQRKLKTVQVISIPTSESQSARLKTGQSYIFSGKLIKNRLFVGQESILEHTHELESAVQQC